MNDYLRETTSYFGLYRKMFRVRKKVRPEKVSFGSHKDQYFLFYEPASISSDKIIVWVHGGGWNAGNPRFFDQPVMFALNEKHRDMVVRHQGHGLTVSPVIPLFKELI